MEYKEYTRKELRENPEARRERLEQTWKYLNEYGIYTDEDVEKYIKENALDIGIFTMPFKQEEAAI
ncbi:hypothetical protein N4T77_02850 [Clostridium sp. CX1]|uniref:hypothetical protein n=1 Tax=Clostridium sp. CX1 TaxID=2978346 RepID=UPI0021BF66AE|nr:hypothetical protein [Clostridium sp. CX1]MCT8975530.1 hypothetical protein [Clostridium sp. CX1]